MRSALDVGAGVDQHRRSRAGRNRRRQGRTIDAGNRAERAIRRHHRGPGMSGAHQRVRRLLTDHVGGNPNRRTRLAPQRRGRRVGHGDDVWRLDDFDAKAGPVRMRGQGLLDGRPSTDEGNVRLEMASGRHGAINHGRRRVVAAHRVNGDADHGTSGYSSSTARTCRCL